MHKYIVLSCTLISISQNIVPRGHCKVNVNDKMIIIWLFCIEPRICPRHPYRPSPTAQADMDGFGQILGPIQKQPYDNI